jgi:hypothetical protein
MRFIKLALISVIAFYLLIWGMSAVLPKVNVMSRVINMAGDKDSIDAKISSREIPFKSWLTNNNDSIEVKTARTSFYENNLFNADRQPGADTIYFDMRYRDRSIVKGGLGLYQLSQDSATVQLFYVFHSSWYKPWQKMAGMINEAKYGNQMDQALQMLKREVEK